MADSASERAAALERVDTVYSKRGGEKLCSLRVLCHEGGGVQFRKLSRDGAVFYINVLDIRDEDMQIRNRFLENNIVSFEICTTFNQHWLIKLVCKKMLIVF